MAKQVEVIILPVEETRTNNQKIRELLLQAPTLTNDEVENYNQVRDWMNSWKVKEF